MVQINERLGLDIFSDNTVVMLIWFKRSSGMLRKMSYFTIFRLKLECIFDNLITTLTIFKTIV